MSGNAGTVAGYYEDPRVRMSSMKEIVAGEDLMAPYAKREDKQRYDRERYQRLRQGLIEKLGGVCQVILKGGKICGSTAGLEIHHITPYKKRSRPNSKSYFDSKGKELRCGEHHRHTESWRKRGKGRRRT